ncbi:MAG TPA: autotransporter outer membrane beta-barrel domain-containing protein, partial [Bdellovibrionota bacterium]|nr:autotransporter outer membrane beta-barrel domain-containing protein [Bdellovibrionota bacterium]
NRKQYDLLRPEAGIGIAYTSCFDCAVITVDASASYIREERYLGKKTKARFNGSCCNFTVKGLNPENNLFSPTARITLDMIKSLGFSLSLGYHGEFGSHFVENAGEAEVSFSF